jgi:hypothetical protein
MVGILFFYRQVSTGSYAIKTDCGRRTWESKHIGFDYITISIYQRSLSNFRISVLGISLRVRHRHKLTPPTARPSHGFPVILSTSCFCLPICLYLFPMPIIPIILCPTSAFKQQSKHKPLQRNQTRPIKAVSSPRFLI